MTQPSIHHLRLVPNADEIVGRETKYRIAGLDLGKMSDSSALCVMERRSYTQSFMGPKEPWWKVRVLKNYALGTDYVDIAKEVLSLPIDILCVDATGGGAIFVDVLKDRAIHFGFKGRIKPIVLATSAMREASIREKGYWSVPKREIVTAIISLYQQKLLKLTDGPSTQVLMKQMAQFKMSITPSANMRFESKSPNHDDLVIALGLCCWWGGKFGNREPAIFM